MLLPHNRYELGEEVMNPPQQTHLLQTKVTDRGLVLTLGDALFTRGRPDLKPDATGNLNELLSLVNNYPSRAVTIEGHTACTTGGDNYNHRLSQGRADAVQSYLIEQGVGPLRLLALGKGDSAPVAGNDSAAGREQNHRVEVIISNPPDAST